MKNAAVHIHLELDPRAETAIRAACLAVQSDGPAAEELAGWLEGRRGPVLVGRRAEPTAAVGVYRVVMELSDGFADFVAVLRARRA